jgi:hypothetical protein
MDPLPAPNKRDFIECLCYALACIRCTHHLTCAWALNLARAEFKKLSDEDTPRARELLLAARDLLLSEIKEEPDLFKYRVSEELADFDVEFGIRQPPQG